MGSERKWDAARRISAPLKNAPPLEREGVREMEKGGKELFLGRFPALAAVEGNSAILASWITEML